MSGALHGVATPSGSHKLFDLTLGAAATSLDTGANGISQAYDVLEIFLLLRGDEAVAISTNGGLRFNNDSGSNYDRYLTRASNAAVALVSAFAQSLLAIAVPGTSAGAGAFALTRITIPAYNQTVAHKIAETTHGLPDTADSTISRTDNAHFRWRSTAAITRVAMVNTGAWSFIAGSRMIIYGR